MHLEDSPDSGFTRLLNPNLYPMKSKTTAGLLALFFGGIGIHKFYLGKWVWGIVYILFCWTFIPAIVALVEAILLFAKSEHDFNLKYNGNQYISNMVTQGVMNANAANHPSPVSVNISTTDFAGRPKSITVSSDGWRKIVTNVAGFQHHDGPAIQNLLQPGVEFQLVRDAQNEYDSNAVKVMMGKHWIGYIAKDDAEQIAEAMDNGKPVRAIYKQFDPSAPDYHKLRIEVTA